MGELDRNQPDQDILADDNSTQHTDTCENLEPSALNAETDDVTETKATNSHSDFNQTFEGLNEQQPLASITEKSISHTDEESDIQQTTSDDLIQQYKEGSLKPKMLYGIKFKSVGANSDTLYYLDDSQPNKNQESYTYTFYVIQQNAINKKEYASDRQIVSLIVTGEPTPDQMERIENFKKEAEEKKDSERANRSRNRVQSQGHESISTKNTSPTLIPHHQLRETTPDPEKLTKAAEMARNKNVLVSRLPDNVQVLIDAWEALPESDSQEYESARKDLAARFAAILRAGSSDETLAVEKFLRKHAAERSSDNPLYSILFSEIAEMMHQQNTTKSMQKIAMRFDRDTLVGLVDCLKNSTIPKNKAVLPPLLNVLSEAFAQEFYSLREREQLDKYQNLGNALFNLVEMMEKQDQEPYFWRLFSYMRETWGHISHKIKPGANESGGARGYMKWLLEKVGQFPDEKMRELFVVSLLIGDVQHETDMEKELVQFLVDYVWEASGPERQARRMRIDNAIPEGTALHYKYLHSYGYKGEQEAQ